MDNVKSLKTCVLASGSKGNSTLVQTPSCKILIDLGKSCAYITQKLKELEINPLEIKGILLTHTHHDHIDGIKVFIKKYKIKLYLTQLMYEDIKDLVSCENCIFINDNFSIGDLEINVIKTSHDVTDSNGYIIKYNDKSLVYVTDTGYINEKNNQKLTNHDIYIFESNHDVKMLMTGKYPYQIKQRIQGDRGHLSNEIASRYLVNFSGSKTKYIILAHLSEDNNTKELAINTITDVFNKNNKKLCKLVIAEQNEKTEMIEV